jgi:cytochrome c-type biogenesis protein CcmH/NrfF
MNPLIKFNMMKAVQDEYLSSGMNDVQFAEMLSERLGEQVSYAQVRAARVVLKVYPKVMPSIEVCNLLHDIRQALTASQPPVAVVRKALVLRINDILPQEDVGDHG